MIKAPEPLPHERILVAIDTGHPAVAAAWAAKLRDVVGGIKLGLELFTAVGPEGVRAVRAVAELPIFLDLKFHDIPNTVAGAVRSAAALEPHFLSLHTAGGPAMLKAAREAAGQEAAEHPPRPRLLGITVLTSLDAEDLAAVGQPDGVARQVERLAEMALACNLDGLVCAPGEVAAVRAIAPPPFLLVVPGIRPDWAAGPDDQKRAMTPAEAVAAGADYLVIGRPITRAGDPVEAARRIGEEIAQVKPPVPTAGKTGV